MDLNWMLRGYVEEAITREPIALVHTTPEITPFIEFSDSNAPMSGTLPMLSPRKDALGPDRIAQSKIQKIRMNEDVLGYNLFRSPEALKDYPAQWTSLTSGFPETWYIDSSWGALDNGKYVYMVQAVYADTVSAFAFSPVIEKGTNEDDPTLPPLVTALQGNYPNPFNPSTTIAFDKAVEGNVRIEIFNVRGQRVTTLVNEVYTPGKYTVEWNGTDQSGRQVGSGLYFYRMTADEFTSTKRMVLLK